MAKDEKSDQLVVEVNILWICEALNEIEAQIVLPPDQLVNVNEAGHPWRKWFLSQALVEVRKVIASLMVFKDPNFIQIQPELVAHNSLLRRMHYDLATWHTRKLKEVLARLVLIDGCFSDDYCQLYILVEEIRLKSAAIAESVELYGNASALMNQQLDQLKKSYADVLSKVDESKISFLERDKQNKVKPRFLDEKDFLLAALPLVDQIEQMSLGYFYSSYKLESGRVHANFGVTFTRDVDINSETILHQCIVLLHVVVRMARLIGAEKGPKIARLKRYLKSRAFSSVGGRHSKSELNNGDIVEVMSHLGVIEGFVDGPAPWKYRSFKVRYVPKPIVKGVDVECIPSWSVHKIISRHELIKLIAKRIKKQFPSSKVSRGEIDRKIDVILGEIKFSERDSDRVHLVGSEHGAKLFKEFFSGNNQMGNATIAKVFTSK